MNSLFNLQTSEQDSENSITLPNSAWWGGDVFICEVLDWLLTQHIEEGHGHPRSFSEESWREKLSGIRDVLRSYRIDSEDRVEDVRQALHEVADIFHFLWD